MLNVRKLRTYSRSSDEFCRRRKVPVEKQAILHRAAGDKMLIVVFSALITLANKPPRVISYGADISRRVKCRRVEDTGLTFEVLR